MLLEFSLVPVGAGMRLSDPIAEVVRVVDESGLAYLLTPSGTCVEGEWDEVMALLKRCREVAQRFSARAVWIIKIDDEKDVHDKLTRHVQSVEERLGRPLRRPNT